MTQMVKIDAMVKTNNQVLSEQDSMFEEVVYIQRSFCQTVRIVESALSVITSFPSQSQRAQNSITCIITTGASY
jgi:hypothetical protein